MKIKSKKLFLLLFFILYSLFFIQDSGQVQAALFDNTTVLDGLDGENIDATRIVGMLRGLACWGIRFAIITVAIMMVFYGILFLKSRGSPQGMTNAKKALTWGLVGGLVIFGVFTIILSVVSFIGVDFPVL